MTKADHQKIVTMIRNGLTLAELNNMICDPQTPLELYDQLVNHYKKYQRHIQLVIDLSAKPNVKSML